MLKDQLTSHAQTLNPDKQVEPNNVAKVLSALVDLLEQEAPALAERVSQLTDASGEAPAQEPAEVAQPAEAPAVTPTAAPAAEPIATAQPADQAGTTTAGVTV